MQVKHLHKEFDELQNQFGDSNLKAIYGAGCINQPDICFVFMNPTARNISSKKGWTGLRAPWIGTKLVWDLFAKVERFSDELLGEIKQKKGKEWNVEFAEKVYKEIADNSLYITNLSKSTQRDARPLPNKVFKQYLFLFWRELDFIKPRLVITFGNQVSSIVLGKNVKMSDIHGQIFNHNGFNFGVTYYPVGQGRRNLPIAIEDIKKFMANIL